MFFLKKKTTADQGMPKRNWNPEWSRSAWWNIFTTFISIPVDDDTSLMALHRNRDRVIAAARDIADDMIEAFEDRWAE